MDIPARYIKTLPVQSGHSINGPWSKQAIIVETIDDYPKSVCISIWNGRVDIRKLEIGKEYVFHCNIESKEYKAKWYTEISLWKISEVVWENSSEDKKFSDIPRGAYIDIDKIKASLNNSKRDLSEFKGSAAPAKGMNINDFLRLGRQKSEEEKLTVEPDFPDVDIDSLLQRDISAGAEINPNEFIQKSREESVLDKEPDFSKSESKVKAAKPGSDSEIVKDLTTANPVTSFAERHDMAEKEEFNFDDAPDMNKVIATGNAENMPDRFKIIVEEIAKTSEESPLYDIYGTDKNSPEDNAENLNPFHGKIEIDPEKLKNINIARKINFMKKDMDESNDPDFSL